MVDVVEPSAVTEVGLELTVDAPALAVPAVMLKALLAVPVSPELAAVSV
jgi:hypothetical protein